MDTASPTSLVWPGPAAKYRFGVLKNTGRAYHRPKPVSFLSNLGRVSSVEHAAGEVTVAGIREQSDDQLAPVPQSNTPQER